MFWLGRAQTSPWVTTDGASPRSVLLHLECQARWKLDAQGEAMGSWGVELFEDDTACDVRDDYGELIEDGVADDDATRQVLESYREALDDDADAAVVWLALAVS